MRLNEPLHVEGRITSKYLTAPDESINNAAIASDADIDATKLEQRRPLSYSKAGTAASETYVLHRVSGLTARNLTLFAGSVAIAVGGATVTVDIKKNGTSVLTGGPVTFNSSNVAYIGVDLAPTTTTAVVGDVFTAVIVATAGGGTIPTGFFISGFIDEKAE
jgi:hypothetical protein